VGNDGDTLAISFQRRGMATKTGAREKGKDMREVKKVRRRLDYLPHFVRKEDKKEAIKEGEPA